jgi:hypothetical protein
LAVLVLHSFSLFREKIDGEFLVKTNFLSFPFSFLLETLEEQEENENERLMRFGGPYSFCCFVNSPSSKQSFNLTPILLPPVSQVC